MEILKNEMQIQSETGFLHMHANERATLLECNFTVYSEPILRSKGKEDWDRFNISFPVFINSISSPAPVKCQTGWER